MARIGILPLLLFSVLTVNCYFDESNVTGIVTIMLQSIPVNISTNVCQFVATLQINVISFFWVA